MAIEKSGNHTFTSRHIGPDQSELKEMLETVGVDSIDNLVQEIVPESIRLDEPPSVQTAVSEYELTDQTVGTKTLACTGSICELVDLVEEERDVE